MEIDEVLKIKKEVERKLESKNKLEGKLDNLIEQLKIYNYTLKTIKAGIKTLTKDIEEMENVLKKKLKKLKQEYNI